MSRIAKITLGLLVLLTAGIVTANALPPIINSITFGNNNVSSWFQEATPAVGWLKETNSILITLAPDGLSWSNVDKRDSNCTLPTGTIDGGDYITNCAGNIILVWKPSNSVLIQCDFPIAGENTDPNDTNPGDTDPNNNPEDQSVIPTIKITKPEEKTLYFRNINIKSSDMTRIVGYIDIEVEIYNPSDVKITCIKYYIDDILKFTDETVSCSWTWDEKIKGEHTIRVAAFSSDEEICSAEITVSILNLKLL